MSKRDFEKPKGDSRISLEYPLPYESDFFTKINRIFFRDFSPETSSSREELFPFQEFVGKYINEETPYRGMVLFYGLGAGKTRTSIAACDSFIHAGKKIVVLTPASLRDNFLLEYKNYVPPSLRKNPEKGLEDHFVFLNYNAGASFAKSKPTAKDGTFDSLDIDNSVIIIDEFHNFISLIINALRTKRYRGLHIYNKIMSAKNIRIIGLTGTPIINFPFETAVLINVLAGYLGADHKPWDGLGPKTTIFPESEKEFNEIYLDSSSNKDYKIRPEAQSDFCKRLIGYISYYAGLTGEGVYPSSSEITVKIAMSNYQFFKYIEQREYELEETVRKTKMSMMSRTGDDLDMNTVEKKSSFRASTREVCNFAFPSEIPRPWRRNIKATLLDLKTKIRKDVSITEIDTETLLGEVEEADDNYDQKRKMVNQEYHEQLQETLDDLSKKTSTYLVPGIDMNDMDIEEVTSRKFETDSSYQMKIEKKYSDVTLSNTREERESSKITKGLVNYSPKMLSILRNIELARSLDEYSIANSSNPQEVVRGDGNVVVYSYFNKVEGINIFQMILQEEGYEPYELAMGKKKKKKGSKGRFCFWEGDNREEILKIFNSPNNRYGDVIKILLITEAGAEGITVKNVRFMHIMEPYWNEVQIRQVEGRGKRMFSHKDLKPEEKTITFYRYEMTFTPEQQKFVSKELAWPVDEEFTTDEIIRMIAERKKTVTDQIEEFMKQTSVDCFLNKVDNNKHRTVPLVCYDIKTGPTITSSSSVRPIETYKLGATSKEITKSTTMDIQKTEKKIISYYKIRILTDKVLDPLEYVFTEDEESKATKEGKRVSIKVLRIYLAKPVESGISMEDYFVGKLYVIRKEGDVSILQSRKGKIKYDPKGKLEEEKVNYKLYEKSGIVYLENY